MEAKFKENYSNSAQYTLGLALSLKWVWRKDKLQESPNKPVYHDLLGGGDQGFAD